jgi:hypothetical protein
MAPFSLKGISFQHSWCCGYFPTSSLGSSDRSTFTQVGFSPLFISSTLFISSASAQFVCSTLACLLFSRVSAPTCGEGQEHPSLVQIAFQRSFESSFEHSTQMLGGRRSVQMLVIENSNERTRGFVRNWQAFRHSCSNRKPAIIKN